MANVFHMEKCEAGLLVKCGSAETNKDKMGDKIAGICWVWLGLGLALGLGLHKCRSLC